MIPHSKTQDYSVIDKPESEAREADKMPANRHKMQLSNKLAIAMGIVAGFYTGIFHNLLGRDGTQNILKAEDERNAHEMLALNQGAAPWFPSVLLFQFLATPWIFSPWFSHQFPFIYQLLMPCFVHT